MPPLGRLNIKFISSAFACATVAMLLAGCESADEKVNRIISETKGKFDRLESSPKTGKSAEEYGTILAALDEIVKTYPQTNAAVAIAGGSGFGGLSRELVQGRIRGARIEACAQDVTTRCLVELVADPANGFTGKGNARIDALATAYDGNTKLDEFLAIGEPTVWDIRTLILSLGAAGKVDTALQISKLFSDRRVQQNPDDPAQAYLDRVLPGVLRCTADGAAEQCKKASDAEKNISDSIVAAYIRGGISPQLVEFLSLTEKSREAALRRLQLRLSTYYSDWHGTNSGEAANNTFMPAGLYAAVDTVVDRSLEEEKAARDFIIPEVLAIQFWSKHRRGTSVDDVFTLIKDHKGSGNTLAYGCRTVRQLGGERPLSAYVELSRKLHKHNSNMAFDESWPQYYEECLPVQEILYGVTGAAAQGGNVKQFIGRIDTLVGHSKYFASLPLREREEIVTAIDDKMKATLTARISLPIDEAEKLLELRGAASGRIETTPAYPLTRSDLHQRWQQAQTRGALRGALARQDYKMADRLLEKIPEVERYERSGISSTLIDFASMHTPKAALYLSDKKFAGAAIDKFLGDYGSWPLSTQGY